MGLLLMIPTWWWLVEWRKDCLYLHLREQTFKVLAAKSQSLYSSIYSKIGILHALQVFTSSKIGHEEFEKETSTFIQGLLKEREGIRNISVAPRGVHKFVYPLKGNEEVVGHNLLEDPRSQVREDVRRAIYEKRLIISGPYSLRQGGLGMVLRIPVYEKDSFWGMVCMVIDLPSIFESIGLTKPIKDFSLAIREASGGQVFWGAPEVFFQTPVLYELKLPEGAWELGMAPSKGWDAYGNELVSPFKIVVAILSAALAALACLLTYIIAGSREEIHVKETKIADTELALAREATEAKSLAEEAFAAKSRLDHLINKGPALIYAGEFHGDGGASYVSPNIKELLGYDPEECVSNPTWWVDRVHPNDRNQVVEFTNELLDKGALAHEYRFRRKDGEYEWIRDEMKLVRDAEGNPLEFIGHWTLITNIKKVEQYLREERNLLSALSNNSPIAICRVDADGAITFANSRAEQILGLTNDDIVNRTHNDVRWKITDFYGDPLPEEDLPFAKVRATKSPVFKVQYAIERPDGRRVMVETNGTPLFDEQGEFTGGVFSFDDVTTRYHQRELMKRLNRTLAASNMVGRSVAKARDRQELYDQVCEAIVAEGGYLLAWIGLKEENEAKTVRSIAFAGEDRDYPKKIKVTWADDEYGRGPTGKAIREGRTQVAQDLEGQEDYRPWRDEALRCAYRASIAIPLPVNDKVIGALNIYSSQPGAFDEEEVSLLESVAIDLCHGLESIKARQDREEAVESLSQSELRFRTVFEQSGDPIYLTTPEGALLEGNPALEKLHGYTIAEIKKINVRALYVDPAQRDEFAAEMDEKGFVKNKEISLFHKDGHEITCLNTATTWRDKKGFTVGYIGTLKDITEHVKSQRALRDNQQMLQLVADGLPALIAYVDNQERYRFTNKHIQKMYGLPAEQIHGHAVREIMPPQTYSKLSPMINLALQGQRASFETQFPLESVRGRLFHIDYIPHMTEEGKVAGFFVFSQDITGLKEAEDVLAQSEKKFRDLFNGTLDAMLIRELSGRFVEANAAASRLLGYEHEELLQMSLKDIATPETFEKFEQRMSDLKDHGYGIWESDYQCKDGRIVPVEVLATFLEYEGRTCVLSSIRDISRRKKTEGERRQLEVQLRQVQKMEALGTLAGGIAHDFNNILAGIFGYTELALQDAQDDKNSKNLHQILQAAKRARDLVRQILAFSRPGDEAFQPIYLQPVVKETAKLLKASLPANIEVEVEVDPSTAPIVGDPTQIHQVLLNLCTNAAQAMEAKGDILKITFKSERFEGYHLRCNQLIQPGLFNVITVSDTGHGISQEDISKIFDPYFTTKRPETGTGLGLSIVQAIVANHQGVITVESEPGEGSTFQVFLPAIEQAVQPVKNVDFTELTGDECVVLVDNEPAILDSWGRRLTKLGYRLKKFSYPMEAAEFCRSHHREYDIVVTDLSMPKMSGIELAQEILKVRPDVPIILCTGYGAYSQVEKAKDIGIKAFLQKPLEIVELVKEIRKLLSLSAKLG